MKIKKKLIILENVKTNELSLVFSKKFPKGFVVTKFGVFRFFHLAHLSVVFTESQILDYVHPTDYDKL